MASIDYAEAAKLYQSGLSTNQVAAMLGSTSPTILRALRATGTATRSISDSVSMRKRGNKRVDSGYITVCVGKNERKKEHVLIAENVLGRPLRRDECVHHINGDKLDNRNCNLLICSRSYHTWLHWTERKNGNAIR